MKKHLIDYPPRGTACGLYYPKQLYTEGFGTYDVKEVTCQNCQRSVVFKLPIKASRSLPDNTMILNSNPPLKVYNLGDVEEEIG